MTGKTNPMTAGESYSNMGHYCIMMIGGEDLFKEQINQDGTYFDSKAK